MTGNKYEKFKAENSDKEKVIRKPVKVFRIIPFIISLLTISLAFYDFGFEQDIEQDKILDKFYVLFFSIECLIILLRNFFLAKPVKKVRLFDLILFIALFLTISVIEGWIVSPLLDSSFWKAFVIVQMLFREIIPLNITYKRKLLNPAQLFMLSFLLVIFSGTFVLMLPRATNGGITFINALFTSTSAVCVTGLVVVDIATKFTLFGKTAIMILIQIGGLGIMTFTSYFSYFFSGGASYENQLVIQEMTNSDKMTEVFSSLKKILSLTFLIEGVGALLIYFSIDANVAMTVAGRLYFSVFHSVSAFCNAGFSTLSGNLYDPCVRFNYSLQLIVAFLIILGGIGFPILFNFVKYLKHLMVNIFVKNKRVNIPRMINLSTKIAVFTTLLLLVVGTAIFYFLEYNNTLAEYKGIGKVVAAFFSATTPRTAGFNSIDYSRIYTPTVLLTCFLMWIGASPGGTGGGIKTSTFAISVLNSINIARGKDRIDFKGREISRIAVKRAYSQIFLSIILIFVSVFAVSIFDSKYDLRSIIFEVISAFGTVGLSLGITSTLCSASKLVLVITMFVGRVSMLTVLLSLFRQVKQTKYRLPSEDILIN